MNVAETGTIKRIISIREIKRDVFQSFRFRTFKMLFAPAPYRIHAVPSNQYCQYGMTFLVRVPTVNYIAVRFIPNGRRIRAFSIKPASLLAARNIVSPLHLPRFHFSRSLARTASLKRPHNNTILRNQNKSSAYTP